MRWEAQLVVVIVPIGISTTGVAATIPESRPTSCKYRQPAPF